MDFRSNRDDFEVPYKVTQAGISSAINIKQKHLPRTLKKLKTNKHIEERMTHVEGVKQKRKVYFLTDEGVSYTWELLKNIMDKEIEVIVGDPESDIGSVQTETTTIQELYDGEKSEFSLIDILGYLQDTGIYDKAGLKAELDARVQDEAESAGKLKRGAGAGAKAQLKNGAYHIKRSDGGDFVIPVNLRHDIYHAALKQAWEDGQITKDERDILERLQDKLGISAEEHKQIESEIIAEDTNKVESVEIYKAALKQAWFDGVISEDEESLLRELRKTLKISDEQHDNFEKEMKLNKKNR
jgi:DNA-binding PadR family transcriptional regulator